MSDMKCPFCQQELKNISRVWFCPNDNCKATSWDMCDDAWQELIRTRKALDVAVDALKEITNNDYDADWQNDLAQATLEKIKDIK